MKKIMFDDRFGLTEAVLDGRKTITRRVIPAKAIEYILGEFKQEYFEGTLDVFDSDKKYIEQYYLVEKCGKCFRPGDIVAVAQKYKDVMPYLADSFRQPSPNYMMDKPGYNNKMFVRADLMPHHIRITSVRIERLQDISDEDCIMEGIEEDHPYYWVPISRNLPNWRKLNEAVSDMYPNKDGKVYAHFWDSPRKAFAALIKKMAGKKDWDDNPWVFVYEFELVK